MKNNRVFTIALIVGAFIAGIVTFALLATGVFAITTTSLYPAGAFLTALVGLRIAASNTAYQYPLQGTGTLTLAGAVGTIAALLINALLATTTGVANFVFIAISVLFLVILLGSIVYTLVTCYRQRG